MKIKAFISALLLSILTASTAVRFIDSNLLPRRIIYHIFNVAFTIATAICTATLTASGLKLDYLQKLGVTAVLLTPLYESVFYHNYFSSDFKR